MKTRTVNKNEMAITVVAITPTIAFDNCLPNVPFINAPSNGSAMISGINC
jgi:hypothetical protein